MSNNDKRYERAILRVLSEHVEQQVPDSTNLWPLIERRLATASSEPEINQRIGTESLPISLLPVQPSTTKAQSRPTVFRPAGWLTSMAALLLIAAVSAWALTLPQQREDPVISPPNVPVAIETPSLNGEATYLFSIPNGGDDIHYVPPQRMGDRFGLYGFDVADDGSFWLGDADNRLLHYSPTGERLNVIQLENLGRVILPPPVSMKIQSPTATPAPRPGALEDLKLQGSNIWIAYREGGVSVDKLSSDGALLEHYLPIWSHPGESESLQGPHPQLIEGGNGQMLLSIGGFAEYVKIENVDIIKTGKNMITIDGFPGREKVYKRPQRPQQMPGRVPPPPDGIDSIMLGDLPVRIGGYGEIISWTILKEMPDLSFYVALSARGNALLNQPSGPYLYILHFGADGKLIERARVPAAGQYGQVPREVAIAPDGRAYALRLADDRTTGKVYALDALRLNFYPAAEQMPPIPTSTATPVLPTAVPTVERPGGFIPPPAPTDPAPPQPTEDTTPLGIVPDGDGYRVQGLSSDYVFSTWLDSIHFLIPLAHPANPYAGEVMVNLNSGTLIRSENKSAQEDFRTVPNPDGSYALLLWDNRSGEPGRIAADLLQTGSGNRQTVIDTNPDATQLAGPDARSWQFGQVNSALTARWIDNNTYLLVRTPLGDGENGVLAWEGWGKILVGDASKGTMHVLTERGDVVGVLPDGSLLLRKGWIDGAVYLLPPPYTGQGTEILPAGKWRTAWAPSPDGSRLAWFDVEPSPGDWSRRLPTSWFSEDPQPTVTHIAVWERSSGNIERFPVQDVRWTFDTFLTWRKDSSALLYVSHPPEVVYTDLNELTLDGKTTHLARHDGNFIYGIRAETRDGSLYYEATSDEQNSSRLMRTLLGGGAEVVCAYIGRFCALDGDRLITVHPDQITIEHLSTGNSSHVSIQGKEQLLEAMSNSADRNVMLSPDGQWLAIREYNSGTFHFLKVK